MILGAQANLLAEVSQCIHSFQRAVVAIGTQYGDASFLNRVTAFTVSDCGRTFPCNGQGSDRGRGPHSLRRAEGQVSGFPVSSFPRGMGFTLTIGLPE